MHELHPNLYSTRIPETGTWSGVLYVLHGIFGSGRNWASVMRRFVRAKPNWSARLIDLRQHGDSQGFAPPHSIAAAAHDLAPLAQQEKETPAAILGHSFGGKVALAYARDHGDGLKQVWVIDSTPEARPPGGSAWQMLELLRTTPRDFANRDELINLLTGSGIALPVAQWMATNLELADGRYRWRFDLDAIEQMMRDFFEQDLWGVLESPPGNATIHVVKASESSVLSTAAVERINQLSQSNGRVFLHVIEGGHWVNAENPDALLALMSRYL
jgi:esterase